MPLAINRKNQPVQKKNLGEGPVQKCVEYYLWSATSYHNLAINFLLAIVTTLMAVHLILLLECSELAWHGPSAMVFNVQRAKGHIDKAHVTPILTPRIAYNPVFSINWVSTPTHQRDHMIMVCAWFLHDSGFIIKHWV